MGRPKGVKNKQQTVPELKLPEKERLEMIAKILIDTFDQIEQQGGVDAEK